MALRLNLALFRIGSLRNIAVTAVLALGNRWARWIVLALCLVLAGILTYVQVIVPLREESSGVPQIEQFDPARVGQLLESIKAYSLQREQRHTADFSIVRSIVGQPAAPLPASGLTAPTP